MLQRTAGAGVILLGPAPAAPIEPGSIKLLARVTVTWELLPQ